MKKVYLGYMAQETLGHAANWYKPEDEKDVVFTIKVSELYDESLPKGGEEMSLFSFDGVDFRTPIVIYQKATRKKATEMIGREIYTIEPFELLVQEIVLSGNTVALKGDSEAWVVDTYTYDYKKGYLTICNDWKVFDKLERDAITEEVAQLNCELNRITKDFLEEIQRVKNSQFEYKGKRVFKNYE